MLHCCNTANKLQSPVCVCPSAARWHNITLWTQISFTTLFNCKLPDWEYEGKKQDRYRQSYQISKQYRRTDYPPISHVNISLPAPTHKHTNILHCKSLYYDVGLFSVSKESSHIDTLQHHRSQIKVVTSKLPFIWCDNIMKRNLLLILIQIFHCDPRQHEYEWCTCEWERKNRLLMS